MSQRPLTTHYDRLRMTDCDAKRMKSRGSVVLLLLAATEVAPEPGPKPGVERGVKPGLGFLGSPGCEKPAFNETADYGATS